MFMTIGDAKITFTKTNNQFTSVPQITARCTVHNETVEVTVYSDKFIDIAKEAYRLKAIYPNYSSYYNTVCNISIGLAAKIKKF